MKPSFALLGCGKIGERHVRLMQEFGQLVALADINPLRKQAFSELFSVPGFDSLENMLSQGSTPDVIAVCTPNGLHASHSVIALNAGAHVICEKPMALNVADCRAMIETAELAGRKLFIVKQNRFNPPVLALKKVLDEGRLGRILSIQMNCFWNRGVDYYSEAWRGSRKLAGGTLYTQFSHFIDLLIWLFGDASVLSVNIQNANHTEVSSIDDQGIVTLKWDSGILGAIHYTINSFKVNLEGSITVFGEKGTVKIGGAYLNLLEYQNIDGFWIPESPISVPPNSYGHYVGSMSNHDKVYRNVISVLEGKSEISATGEDGLLTVDLINRIYEKNELK